MNQARHCEECGAELPRNTPEGLCAKCLLQRGLESQAPDSSSSDDEKTTIDLPPSKVMAGTPPREGQRFGDYQLIRLLGEGGMGAVYEAEHLPSERRLALKVLNHALDSPEARKRFLREGQLAASINHANSVYVFGTEEVEGVPVISMEIAPGGTLKDRVKEKGPLPVIEAVDVILQVIAGLEAAHAKGVLHRDIKPANCFLDTDGTVKVGDFGLSISTLARGEATLTASGAFMGTPAFASPEQLRGDELDVRSDIYSVGATLFYLLTGKTPFEGDNLVKLLAKVLEQMPESVMKLRREVPYRLAREVSRCLEKSPDARFTNYAKLRQALVPFSSTAATAAAFGLRFLAACIDLTVLITLTLSMRHYGFDVLFAPMMDPVARPAAVALLPFVHFGLWILYFTVTEGHWGASLGKALCSLRVTRHNGDALGMAKALTRALVFWTTLLLSPRIVVWHAQELLQFFYTVHVPRESIDRESIRMLATTAVWVGWLLLVFSTARRKNGFTGLHDLLSKTRVILKLELPARPLLQRQTESALSNSEALSKIGPYHVHGTLSRTETEEWLLGYDPRLLRHVWIRKLPLGEPPVRPVLRDLSRPGRIRWLNGKRTSEECWDAYEGLSGSPLLKLIHQPQPWGIVRHWLVDLAEELAAALKDRSMPAVVSLDQLWITADGRAKLLDFPSPETDGSDHQEQSSPLLVTDFATAQLFLNQVSIAALVRRLLSVDEARDKIAGTPVPIHARKFLSDLSRQAFPNSELLIGQLKSILAKPALVSRTRRLSLVAGLLLYTIVGGAFFLIAWLGNRQLVREFQKEQQMLAPLAACVERLETLQVGNYSSGSSQALERKALEVYIAGHFRDVFFRPSRRSIDGEDFDELAIVEVGGGERRRLYVSPYWFSLSARNYLSGNRRRLAERILKTHPNPSQLELSEAAILLQPFLKTIVSKFEGSYLPGAALLQVVAEKEAFALAKFSIAWAFLLRGGLLLRILGIAVATRNGAEATRPRILCRSLIAWSPLLMIHYLIYRTDCAPWPIYLVFTLFVISAIWAIREPSGGAQDRLAGTWLVPR